MKSKTQENLLGKTLLNFKSSNFNIYTYLLAKKIDYEQHKDFSLQQLSDKFGFDPHLFEEKSKKLSQNDFEDEIEFGNLSNDLLIEYLLKIHHSYLKDSIPLIRRSGTKLAKDFKNIHPELISIIDFFDSISAEILAHIDEEEKNLFPLFLDLNKPPEDVQLNKLETEHDEAEGALKQLNRRCDGFNCPFNNDDIKQYYQKLHEFSNKLYAHIHIEKDILFPRVSINS